jgi:hypothetical protein
MLSNIVVPYDYFSSPASLNYKGGEKPKFMVGFAITTFFFVAVSGLFVYSMTGMALHSNPVSNMIELYVGDPPSISMKDEVFFFSISWIGLPLTGLGLGRHYFINADQQRLEFFTDETTGQRDVTTHSDTIYIKPCTEDDFTDKAFLESAKRVVNIDGSFCFDRQANVDSNYQLKGRLGSDDFHQIHVVFHKCRAAVPECPYFVSDADVNFFLSNTNVAFLYADTYVDINDYGEPLKRARAAIYDHLNLQSLHEKLIEVIPVTLETDKGLIISDVETVDTLSYTIGSTLTDTIPPTDMNPDYFKFTFRLSDKRRNYSRSYVKIQDVLAGVAGIASTVTLILTIIMAPYFKLKTDVLTINSVFSKNPKYQLKIPFQTYVKAKFRNKKAMMQIKKIDEKMDVINRRLDIVNIARHLLDIEKMKDVTLNEDQATLLNNYVETSKETGKPLLVTDIFEKMDPEVKTALLNLNKKEEKDKIDHKLIQIYSSADEKDYAKDDENPNVSLAKVYPTINDNSLQTIVQDGNQSILAQPPNNIEKNMFLSQEFGTKQTSQFRLKEKNKLNESIIRDLESIA